MRGVDEEDFQETWENLMWTYNTELNYVEITVSEDDRSPITEVRIEKQKIASLHSQRYDKY